MTCNNKYQEEPGRPAQLQPFGRVCGHLRSEAEVGQTVAHGFFLLKSSE